MFDVIINKEDIAAVRDYLENKGLVAHMNNAGLSIGAICFVLNTLMTECDKVEKEMEEG